MSIASVLNSPMVDSHRALSDRFGYLSQHYIAWLKPERTILPEYRAFSDCKVEIQIRSISQHAWAEIEHDLGYKSETAIPRDIRRRFSRLAGLLEIADREFEGIQDELASRNALIREEVSKGTADEVELDGDSLRLYVQASTRLHSLEERVCLQAGIAYIDVAHGRYSRMVEELSSIGMHTIGQLDRFIDDNAAVLERFAVRWLTHDYSAVRPLEDLPEDMERGFTLFYVWLFHLAQDADSTPDLLSAFNNPDELLDDIRSAVSAALGDLTA
jgi:putative GTP pyrophosphokinase